MNMPHADLVIRPLTEAQAGVWYAQMLSPHTSFYNVAGYIDIAGPIDAAQFEQALRYVVAEAQCHQIRVVETESGPQQWIGPELEWDLVVVDLSASPEPQAAAEVWLRGDVDRPFDLSHGPLFRFVLLRLAADRHLWYRCYHHLCIDGFGGALVAHRLAAVYSALVSGAPRPEPRLAGYASLLDEEWAYRHSSHYERDRAYWLEQLAGRPEAVTLSGHPPSHPQAVLSTRTVLPGAMGQALLAMAQAHGASLGQVLTAAFALYQWRLSGVNDLIVGVTMTARRGARMRGIPGMVSNVVPLRLRLKLSMRWGDLLKQLSLGMRGALRHQRYNGEGLRRDLGLRPDEPGLFGTIINNMSFNDALTFSGHATRLENLGNWWVEDLLIEFQEGGRGCHVSLDFHGNASHYSRALLEAHQARFMRLLERLCEWDGARPLYQVDLLSSQERREVLEGFKATHRELPETTLIELFEFQVTRRPEATALVFGETSLSYGELNGRANQLAHHLIGLGVGPERLVGVCLERSLELVVSLLGILKAGGAYVPLDPSYPEARLAYMLEDASPSVVISQAGLLEKLSSGIRVIELDRDETKADLAQASAENPRNRDRLGALLPEHPAYVIYTSGSTGQPKGVVMSGKSLTHKLVTLSQELQLGSHDGIGSLTSIGFDPILEQLGCS